MLSKLLAQWSEHSPEAIARRERQADEDHKYHVREAIAAADRRDVAKIEREEAERRSR